jgi:hypothetical protein
MIHVSAPISPTDFDEIKDLSMITIQFIFITFEISPFNIQVLKGEVIPATRNRCPRLIGTFHICSPNFSSCVMTFKMMVTGNRLPHYVVHIQSKCFRFLSDPKTVYRGKGSCQIFVDPLARFGLLISLSIESDVYNHFLYPTCQTASLPLIFISLRIMFILLTHR